MDKNLKELNDRIKEFDDKVIRTIECDKDQIETIGDGIIDPEKFLSAKYKILWILKEPYDDIDNEGNPKGGDWDLRKEIRSKNSIHDFVGGGKPTYKPMIYTSFSILNNFCSMNDMDYVENDPSMLDALKSIAYMNVKKLPGHTSTKESLMAETYSSYKDILLEQISLINPDIIIGGRTLNHFMVDLQLSEMEKHQQGSVSYFIKNNKIYLQAYHPAQRKISLEQYCDDIILAVKRWVMKGK